MLSLTNVSAAVEVTWAMSVRWRLLGFTVSSSTSSGCSFLLALPTTELMLLRDVSNTSPSLAQFAYGMVVMSIFVTRAL